MAVAAEQFLESGFEAPRKNGTKRGRQFADFFRLLANARETRAQIFDQVPAFGAAHIVQLLERFKQAGVERLAEAFLFVRRFRHGGGKARDDSGQTQDGDDIHIRRGSRLLAKFFRDAHVSLSEFAIDLHGRGGARVPRSRKPRRARDECGPGGPAASAVHIGRSLREGAISNPRSGG